MLIQTQLLGERRGLLACGPPTDSLEDLLSLQVQRDKAVAALVRWLSKHSKVTDGDMMKIWKGLFYCMFHSDKLQVQVRACRGRCKPVLLLAPPVIITRNHFYPFE